MQSLRSFEVEVRCSFSRLRRSKEDPYSDPYSPLPASQRGAQVAAKSSKGVQPALKGVGPSASEQPLVVEAAPIVMPVLSSVICDVVQHGVQVVMSLSGLKPAGVLELEATQAVSTRIRESDVASPTSLNIGQLFPEPPSEMLWQVLVIRMTWIGILPEATLVRVPANTT